MVGYLGEHTRPYDFSHWPRPAQSRHDEKSQAQCSGPRCNEHPYCPRHKPEGYASNGAKHRGTAGVIPR